MVSRSFTCGVACEAGTLIRPWAGWGIAHHIVNGVGGLLPTTLTAGKVVMPTVGLPEGALGKLGWGFDDYFLREAVPIGGHLERVQLCPGAFTRVEITSA